MVLESADELQAGTVSDVRKTGITVTTEVTLENTTVGSSIKDRTPRLKLTYPIRRLFRVELSHPPVIDVLATPHRVGKMHPPTISVVDVRHRGRHTTFRHHGVGFTEERFADEPYRYSGSASLNNRSKTSTTGADHQNIVLYRFVPSH
jgi:hypothetical protein